MTLDATKPADSDLLSTLGSYLRETREAVNSAVGKIDYGTTLPAAGTSGNVFFRSTDWSIWVDNGTAWQPVPQKVNGATVWTAGTDGAGSGLDADKVQGTSGSSIVGHIVSTSNPHNTTATQVGAITSIGGVGSSGASVGLEVSGALTKTTSATGILLSESHSTRSDNPHGVTAAQAGAVNLYGDSMHGALSVPALIVGGVAIGGAGGSGLLSSRDTRSQIAQIYEITSSWPVLGNDYGGVASATTATIGDDIDVSYMTYFDFAMMTSAEDYGSAV